jgi:ribulose-phosphate 3-epimerase
MWSADQIRLADDLTRIDAHGVRAGMVLRVETPAAHAALWLPRLDMLTLLGTAIGVKGQGLDPTATARLQEAGGLIAAAGGASFWLLLGVSATRRFRCCARQGPRRW